jgi:flagellar hook-basal body complex protein FliE
MEPVAPIASALTAGLRADAGADPTSLPGQIADLGTSGPEASLGLGETESAAAGGSVAPAFGAVLNQFLQRVDGTQHAADAMVESLALGEPVDVHQVMLALNEAADALHLTMTVRGKILDAYAEVMRTAI